MNNFISFIKENRWIIIIILVAMVLRFYRIGFQSAWMDEIYTMNVANPSFTFTQTISEINLREGFPYLYFLTLKTLFALFGHEPQIARAFSVIFGVASVYAIYRLGKLMFTKNVGLIAAMLLCVSEYAIYISQDARPYTFYLFCVILSYVTLIKFLRSPTLRTGIFYGLSAGLLLNSNFFSLVNLFTHSAIILYFLSISTGESRAALFKNGAIAGLIALLLFAPNYVMLKKMLSFKSGWIPAPTSESLSLIFKEFLGNSEVTSYFFLALSLYFLFNLFSSPESKRTREEILNDKLVFSTILLTGWIILFILVVFAQSYLDASMMITRYYVSALPALLLVFAIALYQIKNSVVRFVATASLLCFMLINLFAVKNYYNVPKKTQYRETAAFVISNNKNNAPVFTSIKYWFDFYFGNGRSKISILERLTIDAVVAEMASDTAKVKAFWYMDAHSKPFVVNDKTKAFLDQNYYLASSINMYDAWAKYYVPKSEMKMTIDLAKYNPMKPQNGHPVRSNLESFEYANNNIKAFGWAFLEGMDAVDSEIALVLIADNTGTKIPTEIQIRADVSKDHGFKLDKSGFFVDVTLTDDIPKGSYKVGILVKNTSVEGLLITDKILVKE